MMLRSLAPSFAIAALLLGALPAAGVTYVVDDFVDASSGSGWAAASTWGAGLSIVTSTSPNGPTPPEGRSTATPAFRAFDGSAVAAIDAGSEVWVGFVARLSQAGTSSSFAGVSLYGSGSERFFMGADYSGTTWGLQTVGLDAGSSSIAADTNWVSLVYHFDFLAGQVDLYVDGVLRVAGYGPMPARGWDQVRIASSASHLITVDQLRIGTSQADVKPTVGLVPQSTANAPILHCLSNKFSSCTFETEETDCPGSFCQASKSSCITDGDCPGVCVENVCTNNQWPCNSNADCVVKSCTLDRDRTCNNPAFPGFFCGGSCDATCVSSAFICQSDGDCQGTCDTEFNQCTHDSSVSCTTDADCQTDTCAGFCSNGIGSCTTNAECNLGSCQPETCVEDFCDTREEDIPVYSWKLCPQCGETGKDPFAQPQDQVVVPADGIPFNRFLVGECLFDQSTDLYDAVIGYSPVVLTGGFDCCAWQAQCQPEQTCGNLEGLAVFAWGDQTGTPINDSDGDQMPDPCDNCPNAGNFGASGTCTAGSGLGTPCTSHGACGSGGFCSLVQEDGDSDQIGDACDPDVVPEPGGLALLLSGAACVIALARRRAGRR